MRATSQSLRIGAKSPQSPSQIKAEPQRMEGSEVPDSGLVSNSQPPFLVNPGKDMFYHDPPGPAWVRGGRRQRGRPTRPWSSFPVYQTVPSARASARFCVVAFVGKKSLVIVKRPQLVFGMIQEVRKGCTIILIGGVITCCQRGTVGV